MKKSDLKEYIITINGVEYIQTIADLIDWDIIVIDITGRTETDPEKIVYYKISSGQFYKNRLYMSITNDDNYFLYCGKRIYLSNLLFYPRQLMLMPENGRAVQVSAGPRRLDL